MYLMNFQNGFPVDDFCSKWISRIVFLLMIFRLNEFPEWFSCWWIFGLFCVVGSQQRISGDSTDTKRSGGCHMTHSGCCHWSFVRMHPVECFNTLLCLTLKHRHDHKLDELLSVGFSPVMCHIQLLHLCVQNCQNSDKSWSFYTHNHHISTC